uniref:CCHC-type domain-containing protein n=1 Tax=Trichuris muris TaxID=70415 RepID=A0A5S6QYL5_TRIMR
MAMAYNDSLEAFDVSSGIDGWEDWIERLGFFAEVNNVPQTRLLRLLFAYCGPALHIVWQRGSQCYRCRKLGHVSKVCRSTLTEPAKYNQPYNPSSHPTGKRGQRKVHAVAHGPPKSYLQTSESEDDSSIDNNKIGALKINATTIGQAMVEPAITIPVLVNGPQVKFEIDSGSALTLINEKLFHRLWNGYLPILRKLKVNIRTWSRESMTVLGSFRAKVQYRDISQELDVFVLRNGGQPLLGGAWFRPLNITLSIPIYQAHAISESTACRWDGWKMLVDKYADVFQPGLEQYVGLPIQIELVPGARPRFFKCRQAPFALVDRVKEEI